MSTEKLIETTEKSIEPRDNLMNTLERLIKTLGKSMNIMEKLTKTMEKSMNNAHDKFQLQNSATYGLAPTCGK